MKNKFGVALKFMAITLVFFGGLAVLYLTTSHKDHNVSPLTIGNEQSVGSPPDAEYSDLEQPSIRKTNSRLSTVKCWFDIPKDKLVQCFHWMLEEIDQDAHLAVVVIRDQSSQHFPDPIVYLSGGPGSSTYLEPDNISSWFLWQELTGAGRDLVLVDQRGTGYSRPRFDCDGYEKYVREISGQRLSMPTEFRYLYESIEQCIATLDAKGLQTAMLSTEQSANDMQGILLALQYEQWNLVGGSYGTRLALEWLRHNPRNIRSAILDSVYPHGKGSIAEWPESIANSFKRLWTICDINLWCDEQPKELQQRLNTTLNYLERSPQRVSLSLWQGGWPVQAVIDNQRFVSVVYQSLYDSTLHETIVSALHEIPQGNTAALRRLAENALNSELAPEFTPLVYFAIECKETPQTTEEEYRAVVEKYPQWRWITEDGLDYDICPLFGNEKTGELSLLQYEEIYRAIDTPILLLSGGLDPVTPSQWADELGQLLPNAAHWHYPSIGHGVINSSGCVHQSIKIFLSEPLRIVNSEYDSSGEQLPAPCL
ncbi:alpha/beta fold hydrolase [Aurantivibrio plasticivorans]